MPKIKAKNYYGEEKVFDTNQVLYKSATDDGTLVPFTYGEAVDKAVDLNFTDSENESQILDEQVVPIAEGELVTGLKINKPVNLVPENIALGIDVAGVVGKFAGGTGVEKTVDLSMVEGDQIIEADEDTVMTRAIVRKPIGLVPENIKKDVDIGGIVGKMSIPKLNAPTLSKAAAALFNNITVVNPSTNGNFASDLNFYIDGELVTTKQAPGQGLTLVIADVDLYNGVEGEQTIGVEVVGEGFENSDKASIATSIYSVNFVPAEIDDGFGYPAIRAGATYDAVINEKNGISGYLPIKPVVKMGDIGCDDYVWERDLGIGVSSNIAQVTRYKNATLKVPNVVGRLDIDMSYDSSPKLDPPIITNENGNVLITPPTYAEQVVIYLDGEEYYTVQGISYVGSGDIVPLPKDFGCKNTLLASQESGDYNLGKLKLTAVEETTLVLRCVYHQSGSISNYGMLSKLDVSLSASSTADSSTNLQQSFYNLSSSTIVREVVYTVPPGEHTIDAKFRCGTTASGATATFGVALYKLCNAKTIELIDYNKHIVSAIAKGPSSNSVDSDMVSLECQTRPQCEVKDRILTVSNIIEGVEQIAIYINNTLVDTVAYEDSPDWNVDLTNYPYHDVNSSVYIKAYGVNIESESYAVTANLSIPAPTISMNGTILTLSNVVSQANEVDVYVDGVLFNTYTYNHEEGFSEDIADAFTGGTAELSWNVEKVSGATYGFSLNTSGYYVSGNKGIGSSYALCKVNLINGVQYTIYVKIRNTELAISAQSAELKHVSAGSSGVVTATFRCINYAEANYDYGLLSALDKTLALSASADSTNVAKNFKGSSKSSVQTYSYSVPAGEHFVYVKFIKDGSANKNNDTLQFTVV